MARRSRSNRRRKWVVLGKTTKTSVKPHEGVSGHQRGWRLNWVSGWLKEKADERQRRLIAELERLAADCKVRSSSVFSSIH